MLHTVQWTVYKRMAVSLQVHSFSGMYVCGTSKKNFEKNLENRTTTADIFGEMFEQNRMHKNLKLFSHLHSGFRQFGDLGQFFSKVYARVLRFLELFLEYLQLSLTERCSVAPKFGRSFAGLIEIVVLKMRCGRGAGQLVAQAGGRCSARTGRGLWLFVRFGVFAGQIVQSVEVQVIEQTVVDRLFSAKQFAVDLQEWI